jgi:glycosyltransferase involved in cell wall biosynthesis
VDFWDIDEMANQITAAVQNDPLRDNLLKNAQIEYRQMSWDGASRKIINLYNEHMAGMAA